MGEFDLIERFFKRKSAATRYSIAPTATDSVALGIGDDCALIQPAPGQQLAVSSDMLVEGRHFFADVDPAALGHKALAVNLSDLAAMGAEPLAFTLALALPPACRAPCISRNALTASSTAYSVHGSGCTAPLASRSSTARIISPHNAGCATLVSPRSNTLYPAAGHRIDAGRSRCAHPSG